MEKIDLKVIQAMNEYIVEKYLEGLKWTKTHKIILFTTFPYTGAPNLSESYSFLMADDLTALSALRIKHSSN